MLDLVQCGAVTVLTLFRPPVSAINSAWITGFHELLDEFGRRDDRNIPRIRGDQRVSRVGPDLEQTRRRFAAPDAAEILAEEVEATRAAFATAAPTSRGEEYCRSCPLFGGAAKCFVFQRPRWTAEVA